MEDQKKPELKPLGGEVTFNMPTTNALATLKKAERGRNLTAKYMTVEDWAEHKGEERFCYFLGFKEAADPKGDIFLMAKLHDGKTPFVAAQTILVQSLANTAVGQGVAITCTDVVKNSKNGKTALFEIVELNINLMGNDDE